VQHVLAEQSGRFALWLPVFMGAGVLLYFSLRFEPPFWVGPALAVPLALGAALAGGWARPTLLPPLALAAGFAAAQLATARALPLDPLPREAVHLRAVVRGVELLPEGRRITLASVQIEGSGDLHRALQGNRISNLSQDLEQESVAPSGPVKFLAQRPL
jgi:competence protein ComEC